MVIEENRSANYIRIDDQMQQYEPNRQFELMIRRMPRDDIIPDLYYNQENNQDKYSILNQSNISFDPDESLDELPQPRRMAMHKGGGKPIKMGTILEMDEGEDFENGYILGTISKKDNIVKALSPWQ